MANLQPITMYSHATGPNPWKVAMLFEELGVPYQMNFVDRADLKKPPYEKICINGRTPAIEDPNTGITLWESGAIFEYLEETYDKERRFTFAPGTKESYLARQWLYFQVSGQGPYFGQAMWFKVFHPEKVQSAQDRYINEIRRVSGMLNRALEGKEWLVGDKYSYADLSFLSWYESVKRILTDQFDILVEFPHLSAWLDRIRARPAVAKVLKAKAEKGAAVQAAAKK